MVTQKEEEPGLDIIETDGQASLKKPRKPPSTIEELAKLKEKLEKQARLEKREEFNMKLKKWVVYLIAVVIVALIVVVIIPIGIKTWNWYHQGALVEKINPRNTSPDSNSQQPAPLHSDATLTGAIPKSAETQPTASTSATTKPAPVVPAIVPPVVPNKAAASSSPAPQAEAQKSAATQPGQEQLATVHHEPDKYLINSKCSPDGWRALYCKREKDGPYVWAGFVTGELWLVKHPLTEAFRWSGEINLAFSDRGDRYIDKAEVAFNNHEIVKLEVDYSKGEPRVSGNTFDGGVRFIGEAGEAWEDCIAFKTMPWSRKFHPAHMPDTLVDTPPNPEPPTDSGSKSTSQPAPPTSDISTPPSVSVRDSSVQQVPATQPLEQVFPPPNTNTPARENHEADSESHPDNASRPNRKSKYHFSFQEP